MSDDQASSPLNERFRGYLPVIVDVETGGFNAATDALLEIAMVTIEMDHRGRLVPGIAMEAHLHPFDGANVEKSALDFTGIDLDDPNRQAEDEKEALPEMFKMVRGAMKEAACKRAILVGHNAHFDLGFLNAVCERTGNKRNPFHPFSCFDTSTLAGLALGHTVLAKACKIAGIDFDNKSAHSALYDARKTAELFCLIVNEWAERGGWDWARALQLKNDPA